MKVSADHAEAFQAFADEKRVAVLSKKRPGMSDGRIQMGDDRR